jgi:hypothetical protein
MILKEWKEKPLTFMWSIKMIEIYFYDLTEEKQKEILDTFGENCNYDIFPIATIGEEGKED